MILNANLGKYIDQNGRQRFVGNKAALKKSQYLGT